MCIGNSQEKLGIGYSAEEDTALAEVLGGILEHHAYLGHAFERIVHAKLHRDGIKGTLECLRRETGGD